MILIADPEKLYPVSPPMHDTPVGPEATNGYSVFENDAIPDDAPHTLKMKFYPAGIGLPPVLVGQMMKGRAAIDARLSMD